LSDAVLDAGAGAGAGAGTTGCGRGGTGRGGGGGTVPGGRGGTVPGGLWKAVMDWLSNAPIDVSVSTDDAPDALPAADNTTDGINTRARISAGRSRNVLDKERIEILLNV